MPKIIQIATHAGGPVEAPRTMGLDEHGYLWRLSDAPLRWETVLESPHGVVDEVKVAIDVILEAHTRDTTHAEAGAAFTVHMSAELHPYTSTHSRDYIAALTTLRRFLGRPV